MDDLTKAMNSILSDPESMNKVRQMAENLLGGEKEQSKETDIDMAKIMKIITKMRSSENGDREKLLLALRPHLKDERKERLDTAVKILKLIEIAPLIKDSGIF